MLRKTFTGTPAQDLINLVAGKKLGEGIARKTYVYRPDPTYVIKLELRETNWQNILEWTTWDDTEFYPHARKWLAPCHSISPNGIFLIQRRTDPVKKAQMPRKVPSWLTDLKCENFGMLDGRIVCHDYAHITGNPFPKRERVADWWSLDDD